MEVYLIRHTTPRIVKGICYGQSDIEVDETTFDQEFAFVAENIPKDIDKYFSSPLQRCTRLANKLCRDFTIDERLLELNFGDWEMKKWNEIDQSQLNAWMQDFVNIKTPNGETYRDLYLRTRDFISDISKSGFQKIAIITHAGNLRSFISLILSLPLENSFRIRLDYASVVSGVIGGTDASHQLISILHQK